MTYKFSVVMPVFNLENYLDESIGSLLSQSIGFEQAIQLILVNDGSTDRTEEICRTYRNRYPENVMSRAIHSFNNNGKLLWMNNRLYIEVDDCYIPLPMDIRSLYDDGVSFDIRFH